MFVKIVERNDFELFNDKVPVDIGVIDLFQEFSGALVYSIVTFNDLKEYLIFFRDLHIGRRSGEINLQGA